MDCPPSVREHLESWRQGAVRIVDALAAGAAADWPAARAAHDAALGRVGRPADGVSFSTVDMEGVPALVAVPDGDPGARRLLYFHGGGYCCGSADAHRNLTGHLAHRLQARVYVPDDRLAPEHPHPAQILDAVTAYRWLLARDNGSGPIALAGDSAGGAMVLTLMRRARDAGLDLPADLPKIKPTS